MSILLADDDVNLATFLSKSLESEGYSVHTALDERSALAELSRQNYKLIILDLNFGNTDGLKLLEKLRSDGLSTPVLVLSARNRVSDRVQSLNLGADDYVTKPFSFQELAARANALLRRKADPALNVLRVEDLELDPAMRRVTRGKREIKLSPKEFELMYLLMRHAGNTVTRQELLHESWGLHPESDSNLVDVYVNYLRRKIDFPGEQKLINTVRGQGYRMGRPAPLAPGADTGSASREVTHFGQHHGQGVPQADAIMVQQTPLRSIINSVAHDLAQPLTSVRCFLEVATLHKGSLSAQAPELKSMEQQADRAIGLAKTISSLVRDVAMPSGPWVSLEPLLDDVFNDFVVLVNSGLISVERQGDPSIQVTSSPVLRQLLVLFVGKLVARNTRPLVLTVSAEVHGGCCTLGLHWKSSEQGIPVQDARAVLSKEIIHIHEMVYSIGGELSLPDGEALISLRIPAAPQSGGSKQDLVH
ncbi:MAG TPA: response regulator [Candidatus Angelobacter sp.]|nr:response regulator [Candidatus Angelobacter sp.]